MFSINYIPGFRIGHDKTHGGNFYRVYFQPCWAYNKIKHGRNLWKFVIMWKLHNTILDNQLSKKNITRKIQKYFELNENDNRI